MSENNFNVTSFLEKIKSGIASQKPTDSSKDRKIDKIYLSFDDNFGRYQVFPMPSVVTGLPYAKLSNTREIKMLQHNTLSDGTETNWESWIKILPEDAYVMYDQSTNRFISSLTADDKNLLGQATMLFDQLYGLLGGNDKNKKNDKEANKTIGFMRRRNYTLFHAKCLRKWNLDNPQTPSRENFPALFVCTASGFYQAVDNDIEMQQVNYQDPNWLCQCYTRQLENRTGYVMFSINLNKPGSGKVGYDVSVQHNADKAGAVRGYSITPEEEELMRDPVADFLGWQANRDDSVHLFNRDLCLKTIDYLRQQIGAVRMAMSTGADLATAIKNTSETFLKSTMGAVPAQPVGNDPVLAAAAQAATPVVDPGMAQQVMAQNVDPYHSAPAAQIDPISQQPIAQQPTPMASAPYQKAAFATGGSNNPFAV